MPPFSNKHARVYLISALVAISIIFLFLSNVKPSVHRSLQDSKPLNDDPPDLDQYVYVRTLGENEFPTNHTNKRVIIVGDIHGQQEPFDRLLSELSYSPTSDALIHVGDIITKSPLATSLSVLDFMSAHNITGVRGNNDQKVIGWRAWREWISTLAHPPGASPSSQSQPQPELDESGRAFLARLDAAFPDPDKAEDKKAVERWLLTEGARWARTVPADWVPLSKHYKVARALRPAHAAYLRALPLVLHAPAAHTFVVHAGLLPYDPAHRPTHHEQPLAHWPSPGGGGGDEDEREAVRAVRAAQEQALLDDVPQNGDAWVVMNMRGVTGGGEVTGANSKGTPWAGMWSGIMDRCSAEFEFGGGGGDDDDVSGVRGQLGERRKKNASKFKKSVLPCYPSTVVYGHAAKRGLDIGRWTVGLDSGCTYGNSLSALVLDYHTFHPSSLGDTRNAHDDELTERTIKYGDDGRACVYSVKCQGS